MYYDWVSWLLWFCGNVKCLILKYYFCKLIKKNVYIFNRKVSLNEEMYRNVCVNVELNFVIRNILYIYLIEFILKCGI